MTREELQAIAKEYNDKKRMERELHTKQAVENIIFTECEKQARQGQYKATFPNSVLAPIDSSIAIEYIESQGLTFSKYTNNFGVSWE